jgi:hypothetical protein
MAMGTRRQCEPQEALWYKRELPEAPGHPFHQRMNRVLDEEGFDRFCEGRCRKFYHQKLGRSSLAPGIHFRLMVIGFFEVSIANGASPGGWPIRSRCGSSAHRAGRANAGSRRGLQDPVVLFGARNFFVASEVV